jgi:hypothetical protein
VHGIVPGGGLSSDGERWKACKPGFFLPVRVLSRLFRRRFLEELARAHDSGQLQFFGEHAAPSDATAFADWLAPRRQCEWVVHAKRPFAGPAAVLTYLSRYTHRVAISNARLVAMDERGITFRWKDYRAKGRTRYKTMTLEAHEADGARRERAGPIGPADLHLPVLWCGDARHRDLPAPPADPCATAITGHGMTQGIASTSICASVPCRPPRIVNGFTLRRDRTDSCRIRHQEIQRNHAFNGHLYEIAVPSACQIAAFNWTSRLQIP